MRILLNSATRQKNFCGPVVGRDSLFGKRCFILSELQIPTDNMTPAVILHYFEFSVVQYGYTHVLV